MFPEGYNISEIEQYAGKILKLDENHHNELLEDVFREFEYGMYNNLLFIHVNIHYIIP